MLHAEWVRNGNLPSAGGVLDQDENLMLDIWRLETIIQSQAHMIKLQGNNG